METSDDTESEEVQSSSQKKRKEEVQSSSQKKRKEEVQSSSQKKRKEEVSSSQKKLKKGVQSSSQKNEKNTIILTETNEKFILETRKEKQRKRMYLNRKAENNEEKAKRLQKDKESKKLKRQRENSEERNNRLDSDKQRHFLQRSNETEEEQIDRLEVQKRRQALKRSKETEEEQTDRLEVQKRRQALKRSKETEEEKNNRLKSYKERYNLNKQKSMKIGVAANYDNVIPVNFGRMNVKCQNCSSLHWEAQKIQGKGNSFDDCCNHGKIELEKIPEPPEYIKSLLEGKDKNSRNFFESIRKINNDFAFATMNPIRAKLPGKGPYVFRIHGQIYHRMNIALHPDKGEDPSHCQLFIIDPEEAIKYVSKTNKVVDENMLKNILKELHDNNPFVESLEMMVEEEKRQKEIAEKSGEKQKEVKLFLSDNKNLDQRVYNLPQANEVSVVFVCDSEGNIPEPRIVIREKGKELKILNCNCAETDPLLFPLFLPKGTLQWHPNMKKKNGKRLTRSEFIKSNLAIKENEYNPFLLGRRLFQQYCVDQYVRVENDRMGYIRTHQKEICAENYIELASWIEDDEIENKKFNKIILPSSVTGSPRYMEQNYQDAMAMVRKFGKPDYFLTMTCNPKWPEITENLLPGQTASDRPDLIVKVFRMYKNKMLEKVTKEHCFGKVKAWIYVIEFQKRGLPHMHMLLTMENDNKPRNPKDVDKYINASLKTEDKEAFELIKRHMLHGPCGEMDPNCVCMKEKESKKSGIKCRQCSKNYPKMLCKETTMDGDGYPTYARPEGEFFTNNNGQKIDNSWVVPHNIRLLKEFNCHINFECVNNIKSVKYLYAYIHKGHDKAEIEIIEEEKGNEIKEFQDARYVTPPDALWRIFGYEMQEKSHSIKRLPVHLPNNQTVYINQNMSKEEIQEKMAKNTELMAYFELNKKDKEAQQFLYHQIPEHYIFMNGKWKKRQKHLNTIGRMYFVNPQKSELYYLRLLLCYIRGKKSFEDLKTVEGLQYQSFKEACHAYGLINDDEDLIKCLNEAKEYKMPKQFRSLFAKVLAHCEPLQPNILWEKFKDELSEDFSRKFSQNIAYKKAYHDIAIRLKNEGKSLDKFTDMDQIHLNDVIEEEQFNPDIERIKGKEKYEKLTIEQKEIVDEVMKKLENKTDRPALIFIEGAGGCGKTFTYEVICHNGRAESKKISVMAPTGIAATLLPGGRTVHNRFALDLKMTKSNISDGTKEWKELKETSIFIIDEASMLQKNALKIIDDKLKEIYENEELFGDVIIIIGGDFRQILAIQKYATKSQLIDLCIKRSIYWKDFKKFKLTKNMRTLDNEKDFSDFLLALGEGKLNDENDEVVLPEKIVRFNEIHEEIFGEVIKRKDYEEMSKRAILAPLNVDVTEINKKIVNMLDGEEKLCLSIDKAENEGNFDYPVEYLNTLSTNGLPPHELKLKENAIVMLIRNLNVKEGMSNGTRLKIKKIGERVLECIILTGDNIGEIILLPRITLYDDETFPFTLSRFQFPVKLAFGLTMHKSQGQTLEKVGIDLRTQVFQHGQLYTGFSRTRSWDKIIVRLNENNKERKVKNIVYKEILN